MDFLQLSVLAIVFVFQLAEISAGFLARSRRHWTDWFQEVFSFVWLTAIIKPLIVGLLMWLGARYFPLGMNTFSGWPVWAITIIYLLPDDLLQYAYHRLAHEHPFFWNLHRAHHQAEEMGFFVSYRNAALYYLLMPNIWWLGIITFLGGGIGVIIGIILKQLVVVSSHSLLSWDKPFYRHALLKPVIRVIERIIVTPAFHHAHHGRSAVDGISDPNRNFGNMFSIWDQLFGTAVFTGKFPEAYGLPQPTQDGWSPLLYPIVYSADPQSSQHVSYTPADHRVNEPMLIKMKAGQACLWCSCGKSRAQPFCDGTHQGSKHKPIRLVAPKEGVVRFCGCKKTANPPYCDGSHAR